MKKFIRNNTEKGVIKWKKNYLKFIIRSLFMKMM